jgi:hypothetical protein
MLTVPGQIARIRAEIGPDGFRDPRYREIFEELSRLAPEVPVTSIAERLSPEATEAFQALLAEPGAVVNVEQTVHDCLVSLRKRALQERSREIQRLLKAATGDEKDALLAAKQANAEEIRRLTESGPAV